MKKILIVLWLSVILCLSAAAQKISKPTLTAGEPTAEQIDSIRKGIALHDAKRYDDAIEIYKSVLKENPASVLALYEISLSYYAKKDFKTALDYLEKGTKYKSDTLTSFYRLIGSIADDTGNPKLALQVYEDALKITPNDAVIRYDLAITHYRLGNNKEAKENLKKAIELQNNYPSPHAILANLYYQTSYRIPALLAAMRTVSLELNSPRSQRATQIIREILKGNVEKKDDGTKDIKIFVNPDAPKDEGDFSSLDLFIALGSAANDLVDEKENKKEPTRKNLSKALEHL